MAAKGTYGDEVTLRAVANFYNVEIELISTLGHAGQTTLMPDDSIPFGRIILGNFAEGQSDHYVSLRREEFPSDSELESEINDA